MDVWNTTTQSVDIIKYNSRNTYIEVGLFFMSIFEQLISKKVNLQTSKKNEDNGETSVKVLCLVQEFRIIGQVKIYNPEEESTSTIITLQNGNYFPLLSTKNNTNKT